MSIIKSGSIKVAKTLSAGVHTVYLKKFSEVEYSVKTKLNGETYEIKPRLSLTLVGKDGEIVHNFFYTPIACQSEAGLIEYGISEEQMQLFLDMIIKPIIGQIKDFEFSEDLSEIINQLITNEIKFKVTISDSDKLDQNNTPYKNFSYFSDVANTTDALISL